MENDNQSVTDDGQSPKSQDQIEVVHSPEELTRRLMETSKEAQKYRKERQQLKEQLDLTQARIKEIEEGTLSEQGKYKSLYEKLKTDVDTKEKQYKAQVGQYALKVIHGSIKEQLLAAQCARPDAILKLCESQVRELEIDDDFNPDPSGVKAIVEAAQKDFPEWFKKETPKYKDGVPMDKIPQKPLKEMSKDEIMAALKQLK